MFKKAALIFTIIFSIMTLNFSSAVGEENFAKVHDKVIKKENQYIKISAKIPIIKTTNKKIGDEVTEEISNRFESTIVDVTDLAELAKENDKSSFIGKYEINATYDIAYNKEKILSLYTINYQFTGGAHGITTLVPYNLNLKTGEKIKLTGLFKKNFDYKSFIDEKVNKKIAENPDIYFQDEENKFKTISENQDFYINENGIVIVFPLYEIAPYSSGIQTVLIPKDEIINKITEKIW